jgi:hypothetical protein
MPKFFGFPEPHLPNPGSEIKIPFPTGPMRRGSVGSGGVFPTQPVKVTRNGKGFPSSPSSSSLPEHTNPDAISSSPLPNYTNMEKYDILGNNAQRMHRRKSMIDKAPLGSRYVTIGDQRYFTTTKSPFTDGTYLLYKPNGTYGDRLVGKPWPDGNGWSANPPDPDHWKFLILNGKEYKTRPVDEFGHHLHHLYPLTSERDPVTNTYSFSPNDAAEAELLPNGEWRIIKASQNTPSSSRSGTPAPPLSAPSTRSGTPAPPNSAPSTRSPTPLTFPTRDHSSSNSPSPPPSSSGTPAPGENPSAWQKVRNWFGFS